jgi:hypothetical protein
MALPFDLKEMERGQFIARERELASPGFQGAGGYFQSNPNDLRRRGGTTGANLRLAGTRRQPALPSIAPSGETEHLL